MAKNKSIEDVFEELDANINQLENPGITLEESFKIYNDSMKLLKYCNDSIDKVEKKIIEMNTGENTDEF